MISLSQMLKGYRNQTQKCTKGATHDDGGWIENKSNEKGNRRCFTYPCKLSNNRTSFCVDFLFFSRFFCVRHSITRFCNVFNRLLVRKGNRGEHGEMNNRSLSRGNFWMPNSSKRRNKRGKLFMLKFFLFFTRKSKPKKSF